VGSCENKRQLIIVKRHKITVRKMR